MCIKGLLFALLFSSPLFAAYTPADYHEAMNMAVKFFGGQRCGDTHNWMLFDNPNTTNSCHTKDAINGEDLTGGWHDCGDHIKVATTMGYAATCLLSAFDIWPTAFKDEHDQNYGPANNIPDVLDEAKIATDFFIKSLLPDNTFVYYVGNGSFDHQRWVTSSFQSTLSVELGGDPRPAVGSKTAGGPQACDYASACALMAMHYPDAAYAAQCKEAAIKLYTFAKAHPENINIAEFYSSPNSATSDEFALAAILLYILTKDETYKQEALGYLQGKWESNSMLAWDTVADIAYYYITKIDPAATNGSGGSIKSFLKKNVQMGISNVNSYGIPWKWFKSNWGTNKLACGSALPAALYAKLIEDGAITPIDGLTAESARAYNQRIIDYMLGDNEFKHPFLHGYKGDKTYKVHHRNAMGRNDNPPTAEKNSAPFLFASGALIGGPVEEGKFSNTVEGGTAFMETESGCDYNGPFVAALAPIIARLDPVASGVAKTRQARHSEPSIQITRSMGYLCLGGGAIRQITVCNVNGVVVKQVKTGDRFKLPAGIYLVKAAPLGNFTFVVSQ